MDVKYNSTQVILSMEYATGTWKKHLLCDDWVPHRLGSQTLPLNEAICYAIVELSIQLFCTTSSIENHHILHLNISVNHQFRALAIDSHQHHIFLFCITDQSTANQLVRYTFCKWLGWNKTGNTLVHVHCILYICCNGNGKCRWKQGDINICTCTWYVCNGLNLNIWVTLGVLHFFLISPY